MKLERLNPYLGARITGADITGFTAADRDELLGLLDEHPVLFFTGQTASPREVRGERPIGPKDYAAPRETASPGP